MSRVSEVLKNKNRVEKAHRLRRREEMDKLKASSAYRAALNDELKHISVLLNSGQVEGVIIQIPEKMLSKFTATIYSEEMTEFDITQVEDEADKFIVRLKAI